MKCPGTNWPGTSMKGTLSSRLGPWSGLMLIVRSTIRSGRRVDVDELIW